MPSRWPPMVGAVGFDGGSRPAVALSIPPGELTSDEGAEAGGGPAVGACCLVDNSCEELTEEQCVSADGTWQGPETDCDPNPCGETPTGACCIGGLCSILSSDDCASDGGYYNGDGTTCEGENCGIQTCCYVGFCGADLDWCGVPPENCTTAFPEDCVTLGAGGRPVPDGDCTACVEQPFSVCCSTFGICCEDSEFGNFCCNDDQHCCPPLDGNPGYCETIGIDCFP